MSVTQNENNYDSSPLDNGQVDAIKIMNKQSGKVQLITKIGAALADSLSNVVQVQDCNFDGYPDIWIFSHTGDASPNDGNNYYLYNPKTFRFQSKDFRYLSNFY